MNINLNPMAMNSGKARRQKFGVFPFLLTLLVGVVFAVGGIAAVKSSKIDPTWKHISGTITNSSSTISNGNTTYFAVIKYSVDGKSYQITGNSGSSTYPKIGNKVEVAYDPTHPDNAKQVGGSMQSLVYIFPAAGAGIIVLALVLFIKGVKRDKSIGDLKQRGQKLQGVIVDIQTTYTSGYNMNNNTANNGNAYKIIVSATDPSGQVRNYASDPLNGIGGLAMADFRSNPIPMDVYVDPTNPASYYVDVSEVPTLTPERITELIQSAVQHQQPQSIASTTQQQVPSPPSLTPPQGPPQAPGPNA